MQKQSIFQFDLTDVDQLHNASRIVLIHLAPPCGTASRARERKIKPFAKRGFKEPKPLRTDQHPDGIPGLQGKDKRKTEVANILYGVVRDIAILAKRLGIFISIENPANSLMWKTSFLSPLAEDSSYHRVLFHNCAHGGTRDKLTCFLTDADFLDSLALRCDGTHKHESWQPTVVRGKAVFPTHLEAAYPHLLCQRIATLIKDFVQAQSAIVVDNFKNSQGRTPKSLNRVVLGALPRGKHVAPLVSEYGAY